MFHLFTDHPRSVQQTYWSHLKFALTFGLRLIWGGIACIIHAFLPFIFQNNGSETAFNGIEHFLKTRTDKSHLENEILKNITARKLTQEQKPDSYKSNRS
ncbi:MAG: hypothetical protein J0I93_09640 [Legionella sp.]|nr:hypothetical protein [Legionella sp.]